MLKRAARLFVIKTRFEACAVIYALGVGATSRGFDYMAQYPGPMGYVLFTACTLGVFMAGGVLMDATRRPSSAGSASGELAV